MTRPRAKTRERPRQPHLAKPPFAWLVARAFLADTCPANETRVNRFIAPPESETVKQADE
jgi:hypothetical protein